MKGLRFAPAIAATLCAALGASATAAAQPLVYIDEPVSEVPNAIAVADDGTIAASLFEARSIVLVRGPGSVDSVSIECSPADVAIHPDASLVWAVCQGDPHLMVIDVATGQVTIAGMDVTAADDVIYLPAPNLLVIADLDGQILVTTGAPDYEVMHRIPTPGHRPTVLTALADGTRAYAATDSGQLLSIDLESETVASLTGQGSDVTLTSIGLSRSGTALYATGSRRSSGVWPSFVMRLDPVTGRVLQEVSLDFVIAANTQMGIAVGHRSLSVGTGLALDVDGLLTGAFDVAIDSRGILGRFTSLVPVSYQVSDIARSGDGGRAAMGITNSRVAGTSLVDPPYPPSITLKGRLARGRITLSGVTTSLQPGTSLSVQVKNAKKKGAPFVTQPVMAIVDARGAFTWKGTSRLKRIQVFISGPLSASPTVKLVAK